MSFNKFDNPKLQNTATLFFLLALIFFFPSGVKAAERVMITSGTAGLQIYPGSTHTGEQYIYNFQEIGTTSPAVNNISRIEYFVFRNNAAASTSQSRIWFNLCKGAPKTDGKIDGATWQENNNIGNNNFGCNYSGYDNDILYSYSIMFKDLAATDRQYLNFDEPITIDSNTLYYLEWRYYEPENYPNYYIKQYYNSGASMITYGLSFLSSSQSTSNEFKVFYETTYINPLTRWGNTELPQGIPAIRGADKLICTIGDTCTYMYKFNDLAVGKTVKLTDYNNGIWQTASTVASQTITANTLYQGSFTIPATSTESKINYWVNLINYYVYGIQIEWLASTTELFDFSKVDRCIEPYVCDSVATSTGSFADDFRYGAECGFRKFFCWALVPDTKAQKYLLNSTEDLKASFPFNSYFELINITRAALATSTAENNTLGIPFITTPEQGGEFYIMPVLSSSSMPNAIGQENTDLFRLTIGFLIWGLITLVIIFTIRI